MKPNIWQRTTLLVFAVGITIIQVAEINDNGAGGVGWVVGLSAAATMGWLALTDR